jgi:drug/metabolite transporter superfamily protein YnfA
MDWSIVRLVTLLLCAIIMTCITHECFKRAYSGDPAASTGLVLYAAFSLMAWIWWLIGVYDKVMRWGCPYSYGSKEI